MYNKKALSEAISKLNAAKAPKQKPDILYTQEGQWKYPGEATRIPSDTITMDGVPYPVMAYPNIGEPVLMQPGAEYTFPGADYVDEYPMMKRGGSKGLPRNKTKSLSGVNKLLVKNPLLRNYGHRLFDPTHNKFQSGREVQTLYVDPNDPAGRARYQAYQDSLTTYSTNDFLFKDVKQQLGKDFDKFDVINLTVPQLKSIFSHDPNIIKEYFGRGNDPVKGINIKVKPQYYNQRYNNTQFLEYIFPVFAKPTQPVEYKPNPEIVAKQQQLIDAGYNIGKADGIWGPKSKAAWEEFQNKSQEKNEEITETVATPTEDTLPEETTINENGDVYAYRIQWVRGADRRYTPRKVPYAVQPGGKGKFILLEDAEPGYKKEYQDGGFIDLELTDEEIEQYKKGGYIVEELPKAQSGLASQFLERAKQAQQRDPERFAEETRNLQMKKFAKDMAEANVPKTRAEADAMIESGQLKVETIAQKQAREKREAEAREQQRVAALKAYEQRVNTPGYSAWTGLPGESWRDMLAAEAAPLAAQFRVSQGDNFFDDYINPAAWVGSMAKDLGEAPKRAQQENSYLPYLTSIGMPVLGGALAGAGTKNTGQFVNNVINPLAGMNPLKSKQLLSSPNNFNLEELRRVYHNSERFLSREESKFLHKYGHGKSSRYQNNDFLMTQNQADQFNNIRNTNRNQLPDIPSELQVMSDGSWREIFNEQPFINSIDLRRNNINSGRASQLEIPDLRQQYDPDLLLADHALMLAGKPAAHYPFLTRDANELAQHLHTMGNNAIFTDKPKKVLNKSGLTKEQALEKVSSKDKDILSKMSEQEFQETVLKPTGEIVPYEHAAEKAIVKDKIPVTNEKYAETFNERLDLLNDIIAKNNKSGINYRVKELTPDGRLIFQTPEQFLPVTLTEKQKVNLEWFTRDPKDWLINKAGLKQKGNKWELSDEAGGDVFDSIEEAIEHTRKEINKLTSPQTISGESTWSVRLNPGQWKGNIEDIANTEYLRSVPGLEMSNTMSGVFADHVPRRGTGAYESINEYLKKLDLGRVKPGFNSQTEFSRGAWENFIKSGRGVGFYANPSTVYATMKSVFPYVGIGGAGALGAGALQEKKYGGAIELELTPEEIEWYKSQGYNVEELD
jgi:hypothetical protein